MFTQVVMAAVEANTQPSSDRPKSDNPLHSIWILPPSFFYPVPNNCQMNSQLKNRTFLRPETIAVHHWACSWGEQNDAGNEGRTAETRQ